MILGVFDSGIGGLTVLAELRREFPAATFVYFGDNANLPYGTKSAAQIRKLCADSVETLKIKNLDALVVACNTASSLALDLIQELMAPVPVFGVVGPGAVAALQAVADCSSENILVLATRATIRSHAYADALAMGRPGIKVMEQACPLLVPMIEEGWVDHRVLHDTIAEYLAPYKPLSPGVVLLGCTHYPWISASVEKALPGWVVVDSARRVARELALSLKVESRRPSKSATEWIFTDPLTLPDFARKIIEPNSTAAAVQPHSHRENS